MLLLFLALLCSAQAEIAKHDNALAQVSLPKATKLLSLLEDSPMSGTHTMKHWRHGDFCYEWSWCYTQLISTYNPMSIFFLTFCIPHLKNHFNFASDWLLFTEMRSMNRNVRLRRWFPGWNANDSKKNCQLINVSFWRTLYEKREFQSIQNSLSL